MNTVVLFRSELIAIRSESLTGIAGIAKQPGYPNKLRLNRAY